MKKIYLDTSHLLKWQNNTLDKALIVKLEQLTTNGEFEFVLSPIHGTEIANRTDKKQIIDIFRFLSQLPNIGFLRIDLLFNMEIKHAYDLFIGNHSSASPFVEDKQECSEIITHLLDTEAQKKYHEDFNRLILTTSKIAQSNFSKLDNQQFKSIFPKALKKCLQINIARSELPITKEDEFIDFILNNKNMTPAIKLKFYADLYLSRKNKREKSNDVFDIDHCCAIPYVDYFSLDGENYDYIMHNILKKADFYTKAKLSNNLNVLFADI